LKLFKNIIEDGIEYNNIIQKYNSKNQPLDTQTIEINKVITISLEEYKELLYIKGKYYELKMQEEKRED